MVFGDEIGWNTNIGFLDIYFTSDLKDGVPYLVLDMNTNPTNDRLQVLNAGRAVFMTDPA